MVKERGDGEKQEKKLITPLPPPCNNCEIDKIGYRKEYMVFLLL